MSKVFVNLCLVASLFGFMSVEAGLVPLQQEERIAGGANANIANFPYIVSIQRFGVHSCSGVIYSGSLIITTAHCVQRTTPTSFRVRAGSSAWNANGVLANVYSYRVHENYNANTKANDIALVRLASTLIYSANIKSIPLAFSAPADGAIASLSGWGVTANGGNAIPTNLQSTTVRIISRAHCMTKSYGASILAAMFCAADGVKGACDGDHGSPLVASGQLVGIYSWSEGCGYDDFPGVYTDIPAMRTWIVNNANII